MDKRVEIAVEGIDGVGKTSTANVLAKRAEPYMKSYICNPYHTAREINGGDDVYPLWSTFTGCKKAINLIKSAILFERDKAEEAEAGLIIFDRHWLTAFTEIGHDPELVDYWGDDLVMTALLLEGPTAQPRADDGDEWDQPTERAQYKRRYQEEAWKHFPQMIGQYLITHIPWSFDAVAAQIDSDMRYRR